MRPSRGSGLAVKIYERFVDFSRVGSLNYRLRQRRLTLFLSLIANIRHPIRILDIGGSTFYWEHLFFSLPNVNPSNFLITITNISESELKTDMSKQGTFTFVVADAREMPHFADNEFDVVHSNSVIEHVGNLSDKIRMGCEVRRVASCYFVQTPNFWFPIEPHFKTLFFHWLPRSWRAWLVQRRKFGHLQRGASREHAEEIVDSAQLLDTWDSGVCFPRGVIHRERVLGWTKSLIVIGYGESVQSISRSSGM